MFRKILVAGLLFGTPVHAAEIGLALTSVHYGPYDDPADCPTGLAMDAREVFLKSLPPDQRQSFEERDKRVGSQAMYLSTVLSNRRTADGSDTCVNPTAYEDPPMPTGQAKVSDGLDLDGGDTVRHCPHQEFASPKGAQGIDNQLARLMACIRGVRKSDNLKNQNSDAFIRTETAVTLIVIGGVDDARDDADVTVSIYKSKDGFIKDGAGKPLPDATMRADANAAFHAETRGKIAGGVLTTEPVNILMRDDRGDYDVRGARLRVALGADGYAEGIMAGYYDVAAFWESWSKRSNQQRELGFSCPALHAALHRLADGYKDPATGRCTAISSVFNMTAVRTFVTRP
ncbi:MAG: hypothetical protein K2P94_17335 [Rhodospirillaceae bacterium]|nr:hypothetical protein [Rhodospirillaceae bacterium]